MPDLSPAPAISARDLRLALPGAGGPLPVLGGLSLDVAPGEMVSLVGPSGCGKSTLLSVLAGLMQPDSGEVLIDGAPAPDRLGALSLMPQRDALLPWSTLADNVAIGPRLAGVPARRARRDAREALRRYGLAGFEDHYPHALSGGMRQRAALARTLLGGRRAWLLDEPFGALDALTRTRLVADLAALWAEHRPSALLVTHDLDEAILLGDRVLVCGSRPAQVVAEVSVDLPRPRGIRDAALPEVAVLKGRLLDALAGSGALA